MKTIMKATLGMAAATVLFTGCSDSDIASIGDTGNDNSAYNGGDDSSSGAGASSEADTFNITQTADGFKIEWQKGTRDTRKSFMKK